MSVATVVLVAGTLSTNGIVVAQDGLLSWNVVATGVVPFVVFFIAATAELNRPPFDLVEAEQELVGGYHTEYSSFRFAVFYLAEFLNLVTMSAIIITLFLGGPRGLFDIPIIPRCPRAPLWLIAKMHLFLFGYVWIRATLPRFRYDQLMDLGWKILIPLAFGWFLLIAALRLARRRGLEPGPRRRRRARRRRCPASACSAWPCGRVPGDAPVEGSDVLDGLPPGLPRHAAPDPPAATVTTQYSGGHGPTATHKDVKIPKPERLHGRHVLNRYEDGMEKCIGCELCAGVCPARCIYVRGADNSLEDPVSPGERYGYVYEINYLRCIHCDLCVEACPTEAITETKLFEFSFTNRQRRHLHQGRAARRRRRQAPPAAVGGLARGRRPVHVGLDAGHRPIGRRRLRGRGGVVR